MIYVFIALRLIDGIFLGGEYDTGQQRLLLEWNDVSKGETRLLRPDPERRIAWGTAISLVALAKAFVPGCAFRRT